MRDPRMRKLVGDCVDAATGRFHTTVLACWGADTSIFVAVESRDCEALASAMQGLAVRIAKRVNATFGTRGSVFGQRYDAIVLVRLRRMSTRERALRKVNLQLIELNDLLAMSGTDGEGARELAMTGPPIRTFLGELASLPFAFRPSPMKIAPRGEKRSAILRRDREMMQRFRDSLPMKRVRKRLRNVDDDADD